MSPLPLRAAAPRLIDVGCLSCGSPPGEPCRVADGPDAEIRVLAPHATRLYLAGAFRLAADERLQAIRDYQRGATERAFGVAKAPAELVRVCVNRHSVNPSSDWAARARARFLGAAVTAEGASRG